MKRTFKQRAVLPMCMFGILALASASWGTSLSTEAQIDTITINSSLGVTFGDIVTSVSGSVTSNGSLVAGGGAPITAAGSFVTGVDASVGPLNTTYLTDTQFAYLGTQVSALPADIGTSPLANPLASDFFALGNSNVASLGGGVVTATDTATYTQTFTIAGTGTGTMSLGALGLYNFMLSPDGTLPFTATAEAWLDFLLSDGSAQNYHVKIVNPLRMVGQDVLLLGSLGPVDPATGLPTVNIGDLFGPISVFGGETWTLTASASTLAEINSPAPVPEPGTIMLIGSGMVAFFYSRRRRRESANG